MAGFNGRSITRDIRVAPILAEAMPDTFRWLLVTVSGYTGRCRKPRRQAAHDNVLPNSRDFVTHLSRAAAARD